MSKAKFNLFSTKTFQDIKQVTTNHNQYPANALWVELSTRITTQSLHYRSGNEETAAESVHNIFTKTRELLEKYPEAREFQTLALELLNNTLRPYTARWHGWMTESRENGITTLLFKNPQVRRMFRAELKSLTPVLQQYQQAFRDLADGHQIKPIQNSLGNFGLEAHLGIEIIAGIETDSQNFEVLNKINAAENLEIQTRRKSFQIPVHSPLKNVTGLALSGGGIRSATFCLGIVQMLAKHKLFHQFDYLSTVSGGGYLGSFLTSTLIRERKQPSDQEKTKEQKQPPDQEKTSQEIIDEVLNQYDGKESSAVRHLRNSSKYLGTGGIQWMAGLMVFGILTNLLLLLPIPIFAALAAYLLQNHGFWQTNDKTLTPLFGFDASLSGYILMCLIGVLLILSFVLPFVQSATHGKLAGWQAMLRQVWESTTLYLAIITLFFALIYWLPTGFGFFHGLQHQAINLNTNLWPLLSTMILPFLLAHGAKLLSAWKRTQKFFLSLFVLSGPVFFIMVFFVAGSQIGIGNLAEHQNQWPFPNWLCDNCPLFIQHSDFIWMFISALILLIWGWFFVNINTSSPHRYYRNRLCECYLLQRTDDNKVKARTELPLKELNPTGSAAPYHLINTTLNLTTSKNPELRGRNGDFFLLSKHYCGSSVLGYSKSKCIVGNNPHIDLGSAMAISGAAASTSMGWKSKENLRFWLGLMNIRLGYWLRNPSVEIMLKALEGPGPWYLLKEIFARMKETDRYLNLSDGGHIENLAVYELLKRRCKFIVCVDGGQDPNMECADLIRLQRYAEIDLGIRMEYDVADLQLNAKDHSRAYAILVKIIYKEPDGPNPDWENAELGWMLYTKLAATGTEPAYVSNYRRTNPSFPHQTTGDQFFDEAQFEAYRMLGECAAESLFRDELLEGTEPATLQDWFQLLANNLLPDNDTAFIDPKQP